MKYSLKENYFDKFDTEEKLYLLGLLFADGCNSGDNISIGLSGDDRYLLERISEQIYENHRPLIVSKLSNKNSNYQDSYRLYICGREVCKKFEEKGLSKNKTYNLKFPDIVDDEFKFKHFLRGYFDGDGSVIIQKDRISFSIVGYSSFLSELKFNMEKYINIKIVNKIYDTSSFAKELKISSRSIVRKIYKFMYNESTIYLSRKKIKFDNYFNIPKFKTDMIKSSKYKWVTFDKKRNKWKSSVWKNGKNNNLGRFDSEIEAYNCAINFLNNKILSKK